MTKAAELHRVLAIQAMTKHLALQLSDTLRLTLP